LLGEWRKQRRREG